MDVAGTDKRASNKSRTAEKFENQKSKSQHRSELPVVSELRYASISPRYLTYVSKLILCLGCIVRASMPIDADKRRITSHASDHLHYYEKEEASRTRARLSGYTKTAR